MEVVVITGGGDLASRWPLTLDESCAVVLLWVPSLCFSWVEVSLSSWATFSASATEVRSLLDYCCTTKNSPGDLSLQPPHPFILLEALSPFSVSIEHPRRGKTGGTWEWRHIMVLFETVLFHTETS